MREYQETAFHYHFSTTEFLSKIQLMREYQEIAFPYHFSTTEFLSKIPLMREYQKIAFPYHFSTTEFLSNIQLMGEYRFLLLNFHKNKRVCQEIAVIGQLVSVWITAMKKTEKKCTKPSNVFLWKFKWIAHEFFNCFLFSAHPKAQKIYHILKMFSQLWIFNTKTRRHILSSIPSFSDRGERRQITLYKII